ncbi:MAG: HigA family addiction module antitoxin [Bacteroidota bacterium]|nr:HigA family addiction module antitoxin [Bacteroidota bacterium]
MSASELAREIMVPANRLTQIIAGKRTITAETALRLGKWFGTGPNIWLNLQQAYDLDLISEKMAPAIKEIKSRVAA